MPLALATASPFLLDPLRHLWHPAAFAILAVLLTASMLPLAFALVERIAGEQERRLVLAGIAVCATGALVTGLGRELWGRYSDVGYSIGLLTAGITIIPGFVAAGPLVTGGMDPAAAAAAPGAEVTASGRVLRSAELAIAGFTPAAALVTAPSAPWLFLVWLGAIARRRPVHRPAARPPRDPGASSSATSSSRRPRPSGPGSPPTSTTTRSRS